LDQKKQKEIPAQFPVPFIKEVFITYPIGPLLVKQINFVGGAHGRGRPGGSAGRALEHSAQRQIDYSGMFRYNF
jgi:hypothetical protein